MRGGHLLRPFSHAAGVKSRGYSLPLQRRITDFGADVAFAAVVEKLQEHYGIEVPVSAVRTITERHAQAMQEAQTVSKSPDAEGVACLIAELDGSMIPIVDTEAGESGADRRKSRTLRWQEARLALAHRPGSVQPIFGATLGGVEAAGDQLAECARRAGFGKRTRVHALGDGAPWIAEQVERVFGTQAHYLVDFYHLCDYLAAAAKRCAPNQPEAWFKDQKQHLKTGQVQRVLDCLQPHLEPASVPSTDAPVRACHRYLTNRLGQVDYPTALAAGLPIGSGAVESAHRYVIQKRLKIAGAWWQQEQAQNMLALRVCRANQDWKAYWSQSTQKAA